MLRRVAVRRVAVALALCLSPLPAQAAKPIDARFNAAYFAAKDVVRLCKEFDRAITVAGYQAAVVKALHGAPNGGAIQVVVTGADDTTCTSTVDTLVRDDGLWVRIQVPAEIDDYVDLIYRGAPGAQPKRLGPFVPYVSPACGLEGRPSRELGMTPKRFTALPEAVRGWLCRL